MSTLQTLLKKYDNNSAKVAPSEGRTPNLPEGQYIVVITKGTLSQPKDKDTVFVNFTTKVTEGAHDGQTQRVSQNIIKSDGSLNEVGVSICKGIFQKMFGKTRVPDTTKVSAFEKLSSEAAGQVVKIKVSKEDDAGYVNCTVQAVMGQAEAVTEKEPAASEDEETTTKTEASPETFDLQAHLETLDREELKQFIDDNKFADAMKTKFGSRCKKDWSDAQLRENINAVAKGATGGDED